jgi:hypothetical protein
LQQGIQQGELLALRNVLGDLLVGDVPEDAGRRIADADSGQLRAWINSLIGGASPGKCLPGAECAYTPTIDTALVFR